MPNRSKTCVRARNLAPHPESFPNTLYPYIGVIGFGGFRVRKAQEPKANLGRRLQLHAC